MAFAGFGVIAKKKAARPSTRRHLLYGVGRESLATETFFHHQIKASGEADRVGQGFAFEDTGLIK